MALGNVSPDGLPAGESTGQGSRGGGIGPVTRHV